jgi:hypothetical protein
MFSKAKYVFNHTNKNLFYFKNFSFKNFSRKEVMQELNLSKTEIKKLSQEIKSKWVKPGKEKIVILITKNFILIF